LDNRIAKFWSDRIRAGRKKQKTYRKIAKEVMDVFRQDKDWFDSEAVRSGFMQFKGAGVVQVPKLAEMKNSLAPHLYLDKPVRTVTPTTDSGVMLALSKVIEAYLNKTPYEAHFARQLRRIIDDGILRGRGVLWTGWDPIRKIITSWYVSSLDFVFDPDQDSLEDAEWIAVRNREPVWRTKRRVKDKWRLAGIDKVLRIEDDLDSSDVEANDDDDRRDKTVPSSNKIVESWTVYSKMGNGLRGSDMQDVRGSDKEDYVKLEIAVDHQYPLSLGEWDVQYYLDNDWPCSFLDLVETIDQQWPVSLGGQVLGLQRAVDLLTSLAMTSCKNRDRMILFAEADEVPPDAQRTLRNGSAADFITLPGKGNKRLSDRIHVPDFGQGSSRTELTRDFMLAQMDAISGVTQIMTGAENQGSMDRSATASQLRSSASNSRTADHKAKVQEATSLAARHEAIQARLDLEAEEIAPWVPSSKIGMYYVSIEPAAGAELPVMDFGFEDEDPETKPLTMVDVAPMAAEYFSEVEECYMAALQAWQSLQQLGGDQPGSDPRVREIFLQIEAPDPMEVEQAAMMGMPPPLPEQIQVKPVTVETVWRDTAGIKAEEMFQELNFEIATGSGRLLDRQAERESADNMLQTLMPIVAQSSMMTPQQVQTMNQLMDMRFEAYEIPEHKRVKIPDPPPPPQEGQPGQNAPPK